MGKPLKYALIGLGALLGAVVLAVGAFLATFDPNRYKDDAVRIVKQATGRELELAGDLELDLFPWLALRTGKVALGNAAGFDGPFLTLDRAQARVKVLPLLTGEVDIGEIVLEGASLHLAVAADGRDNWSDLMQGGAEAPAEGATGGSAGGTMRIEGARMTGATLSYLDARDGSRATVAGLELRTSAIEPGAPVTLQGKLEFALEPAAPGAPLSGTLRYGATAIPGAQLRLTNLALGLDAKGAALPSPLEGAEVAAKQVVLGEPLRVEGLRVAAWGMTLEGAMTRAAATGGPRATGALALAELAPRQVLPRLGIAVPQTADPKALSKASGGFEFEQQGDRLALTGIKLKLDQSALTGRVVLESIARKAVRFELALDAFDADRYLPPPADTAKPFEPGGLDAVAIDVAWLRELDVVGTLKAGKLAVAKFDLSDLRLGVDARQGMLRLEPFGAALYGGKVQGRVQLDARGAVPDGKVALGLAGVRIHDLLTDAFGSKPVSGVASLDLDLAGAGATVGALKKDLDGTVRFAVEDGALEGFNVWKQARLAWAKYKNRTTTAASDPDRTEFEQFSGGARLVDGVATLEGVKAAIRFAEATAKGKVDLGNTTLKVTAQAKVNAVPDFGPGEVLKDLNGVTLPVEISGPFAKPKVEVDMVKAATSLMKPDMLKEEKLRKKLKGLFG